MGDQELLARSSPYLTYVDPTARAATVVELLCYGSIQGVLTVCLQLLQLAESTAMADRVLVTQSHGAGS